MTTITALELRRLTGRRSTGLLALATALGVTMFGFVLLGAIASLVEADAGMDAATRTEIGTRVAHLAPTHLPAILADVTAQLAPSLGLVAGTIVASADLRHGLITLFVASGVPRVSLLAGKHVAAACLAGGLALVSLVTAGVCSLVWAAGSPWAAPPAAAVLAVFVVVVVVWCTFAAVGLALTVAARSGVAGFVAAVAAFMAGGGLAAASGKEGWVGTVFSLLPTGLAESSVRAAAAGTGGWWPALGLVAWAGVAVSLTTTLGRRMSLR